MGIRTASDQAGRTQTNETVGSQFDSRTPPSIPRGLRVDVRDQVKHLIAQNVHLWDDSQVRPLLRLATLYADIELMNQQIQRDGMMTEDRFGVAKLNPMLAARDTAMRGALGLERQLGITFTARGNNVKKAESTAPAKPAEHSMGRGAKVRKLQLA